MYRWTSAAALFVLGVVALGGCKDKEPEPQAVPVPTGAATTLAADPAPSGAAPTPADSAAAGASAALSPSGAPTGAAPPSQPATPSDPAAPKKPSGGSIDACCSALSAIKSSGKPATVKAKAAAAAAVCPGIASRVKSGETSRSAALTQIRSAMVGAEVPGECR